MFQGIFLKESHYFSASWLSLSKHHNDQIELQMMMMMMMCIYLFIV